MTVREADGGMGREEGRTPSLPPWTETPGPTWSWQGTGSRQERVPPGVSSRPPGSPAGPKATGGLVSRAEALAGLAGGVWVVTGSCPRLPAETPASSLGPRLTARELGAPAVPRHGSPPGTFSICTHNLCCHLTLLAPDAHHPGSPCDPGLLCSIGHHFRGIEDPQWEQEPEGRLEAAVRAGPSGEPRGRPSAPGRSMVQAPGAILQNSCPPGPWGCHDPAPAPSAGQEACAAAGEVRPSPACPVPPVQEEP